MIEKCLHLMKMLSHCSNYMGTFLYSRHFDPKKRLLISRFFVVTIYCTIIRNVYACISNTTIFMFVTRKCPSSIVCVLYSCLFRDITSVTTTITCYEECNLFLCHFQIWPTSITQAASGHTRPAEIRPSCRPHPRECDLRRLKRTLEQDGNK